MPRPKGSLNKNKRVFTNEELKQKKINQKINMRKGFIKFKEEKPEILKALYRAHYERNREAKILRASRAYYNKQHIKGLMKLPINILS